MPQQILPCYQRAAKLSDQTLSVLDDMGLARFLGKALAFERDLIQFEADELLYQVLMEALGYSQNKVPFKKLASAVNLSELGDVANNNNDIGLLAILYGTAGLLPSQRPGIEHSLLDSYVRALENKWRVWRRPPVLNLGEWSFFRLRPVNFPSRRLAGMARLLQQCSKPGLIQGKEQLVENAVLENSGKTLVDSLMYRAEGYWLNHFDFGRKCPGLSPWTIGEGRAAEIITNVLLPYYYAYGQKHGDNHLTKKSLSLYSGLPQTEENTVEKHMQVQLGLRRGLLKTTRRQQGLLHLYKQFCVKGKCGECLLGK